MSRTEVIAILRRARDILATRGHCRGGPMRTADGSHARSASHAAAFSVIGAIMAASDEKGLPWAVGVADDAIAAVHRVALEAKATRGRHYMELADANDALDAEQGKATVVMWLTRAIGAVNEGKKPRLVRGGNAA